MEKKLVTPKDIVAALKDIGVQKGQAIMVHTSNCMALLSTTVCLLGYSALTSAK